MDVRAKMRVTKKTEQSWGNDKTAGIEVELQAVYSSDKSDPNYTYSQATPTGEVKLQITNPEVFGAFKTGKQYLITFSEVD